MIAPLIGAAVQGVGSAIGAAASSKAVKKANRLLKKQQQDNEQWYAKRYNEDYLQRSDVQASLNSAKEKMNDMYTKTRGINAVAGGTDESVGIQKQKANEMLGNTTRNIAANASNYKQGIENQYLGNKANLVNQERAVFLNKANQIVNAANQVGKFGASLGSAFYGGGSSNSSGNQTYSPTGNNTNALSANNATEQGVDNIDSTSNSQDFNYLG